MFPFDSPELQSVLHDALFLLLKMMTWSFYFWVLVFWFNFYSFAARRGKSKRKKPNDLNVTWETALCNFHICFKKGLASCFLSLLLSLLLLLFCILWKSHNMCKDSWPPAGDTFPFVHCGPFVCDKMFLQVMCECDVKLELRVCRCVVEILFFMQSTLHPPPPIPPHSLVSPVGVSACLGWGVFKRLSPSLLQQQQAWPVWRGNSTTLLETCRFLCVLLCMYVCVFCCCLAPPPHPFPTRNPA